MIFIHDDDIQSKYNYINGKEDGDMMSLMACYGYVELSELDRGMIMQGWKWLYYVIIIITMMWWAH